MAFTEYDPGTCFPGGIGPAADESSDGDQVRKPRRPQ